MDGAFKITTDTKVLGFSGNNHGYSAAKEIQQLNDIKSMKFTKGKDFSTEVALFSTDPAPVSYKQYNITVVLTDNDGIAANYGLENQAPLLEAKTNMIVVNPDFTWWVMGWKVVFQIGILIAAFSPLTCKNGVIAGFFVQQRQLSWRDWSATQAWCGFLLVVLFCFNDPLFPLQFGGAVGEGVKTFLVLQQIIFVAMFISSLLCFMLSSTGTIISSNKEQFQSFDHKLQSNAVIAKVGLCCIIFAFLFFYYIIARLYNAGSPEYEDFAENSVYFSFEVLLGILMGVYLLWYIADIVKCVTRVRIMEKGYVALLVVCILAAIMMVIGISIGALYVLPDQGEEGRRGDPRAV